MKLRGTLPKGESDGLTPLTARVVRNPEKHIVALVLIKPAEMNTHLETGEKTPILAISRIEAILPDDIEAAIDLIRRAYESRTGETTLPIELENDIKDALAGKSLYEPETPTPDLAAGLETPTEKVRSSSDYGTLKVSELQNLLRNRTLDASGKKMELIERLEADDADTTPKPSNVTSLFSDGQKPPESGKNDGPASPVEFVDGDDEPHENPEAYVDADAVADAAVPSANDLPGLPEDDDEPVETEFPWEHRDGPPAHNVIDD